MNKEIITKWNKFANGQIKDNIKYKIEEFLSELDGKEISDILIEYFEKEKESIKCCDKCNYFHNNGDKCGSSSLKVILMNKEISLEHYHIKKGFFTEKVILSTDTHKAYDNLQYDVFSYFKIPERENNPESILFNTQYEKYKNVNNLNGEDVFLCKNENKESIQSIKIVNDSIEMLLKSGNTIISSFNDFYFDGDICIYTK